MEKKILGKPAGKVGKLEKGFFVWDFVFTTIILIRTVIPSTFPVFQFCFVKCEIAK